MDTVIIAELAAWAAVVVAFAYAITHTERGSE